MKQLSKLQRWDLDRWFQRCAEAVREHGKQRVRLVEGGAIRPYHVIQKARQAGWHYATFRDGSILVWA